MKRILAALICLLLLVFSAAGLSPAADLSAVAMAVALFCFTLAVVCRVGEEEPNLRHVDPSLAIPSLRAPPLV